MNNMKRAVMQAMAAQAGVERMRLEDLAATAEARAKRLRKGSEARVKLEYAAQANRVRATNVAAF